MHTLTSALLVVSLLASSPALAAQSAPGDSPSLHALAMDWPRDGIITGLSAALWLTSETVFKKQLAPATCRWCDRAPDGTNTIDGLDAWGRGLAASSPEGRQRASFFSDVLLYGALPAGAIGSQWLLGAASGAPPHYFGEDALIVTQAMTISALTNQAVKFLVGRERPFVHVLPEDEKALTHRPEDNNLSSYSGHASVAFTLAVTAGTVAELRGYRYRAWVWAVGLPLATTVALLRMGADKHYLSDVALGALVGSAIGVGVPLLLHGRQATQSSDVALRMSASLGGVQLVGRF